MPESVGRDANLGIQETVDRYREGIITRRDLLRALIAATGSYTAAHLFLESSGLAATLISQVESDAANVTAETIRYPSGEFQIEGYLVKPKSSGKHPAVIVIHENRGLNEHIRDVARRLAAEGFVALAVDQLSHKGGTASFATPDAASLSNAPDEILEIPRFHLNSSRTSRLSTFTCWGVRSPCSCLV